MTRLVIKMTVVLALSICFVWSTAAQDGKMDIVRLTDGTRISGKVVKEQDGHVWIDTGEAEPVYLKPEEVASVSYDAAVSCMTYEDFLANEAIPQFYTRAAVLTAEGTLGVQMSANSLRDAIPMLREEMVGLVVLKINSGGGLAEELEHLSLLFDTESYFKKNRMIIWVENAISESVCVIYSHDTLYFMTHGNCGQASYGLAYIPGRRDELEEKIEYIVQRSSMNPMLIRSLLSMAPLSYDVDVLTGEIGFNQDQSGEYVLNDGTEILTLNAKQAEHCGFSSGTADTIEELAALLELEYGPIEWVGKDIEGIPYPVCKAEQHQIEYRKKSLTKRLGLMGCMPVTRRKLATRKTVGPRC